MGASRRGDGRYSLRVMNLQRELHAEYARCCPQFMRQADIFEPVLQQGPGANTPSPQGASY